MEATSTYFSNKRLSISPILCLWLLEIKGIEILSKGIEESVNTTCVPADL